MKWDNFNGWCKIYLAVKYVSYAAYACAYWTNKKATLLLGKTMIKEIFRLLYVIIFQLFIFHFFVVESEMNAHRL